MVLTVRMTQARLNTILLHCLGFQRLIPIYYFFCFTSQLVYRNDFGRLWFWIFGHAASNLLHLSKNHYAVYRKEMGFCFLQQCLAYINQRYTLFSLTLWPSAFEYQGSARQLFQRLQGPFEEETLKTHFEKIIFLGQKLHQTRRKVSIVFWKTS